MKRKGSFLFAFLLMGLFCFGGPELIAHAANPTFAEAFPDPAFRADVMDRLAIRNPSDTAVISDRDLKSFAKFTSVHVNDMGICSLQGLEYFPNLKELRCSGNRLTELDLRSCPDLEVLDCSENNLTELDLRSCPRLYFLNCSENNLTELDLTECTKLEYLHCFENQLAALDLSSLTGLTYFTCNNNRLSRLDVTSCPDLQTLHCNDNNMTSLHVAGCARLYRFHCYNNELTALDVTGCTDLETLICYNNKLVSLDVSGMTSLKRLDCMWNRQLTALDVSGCTDLEILYCFESSLTELDVSGCRNLRQLLCEKNKLTALHMNGCTKIEDLDCNTNNLTELNVAGLPGLKSLLYFDNHLTVLDLRGNPAIDSSPTIFKQTSARTDVSVAEENGVWTLDMTLFVGKDNVRYVTMTDGGRLENGRVTYTAKPERVTYLYDTGHGEMEVTWTPVFRPVFKDIRTSDYFYTPVNWAISKNITNGISDTAFAPGQTCTQAHILTFLWRSVGSPEAAEGQFSHGAVRPETYFYQSLCWAQQNGVLTDGAIDPNAPCSRADVVTYLWRLSGKPAAAASAFTDVAADAAYAPAVDWAVEQNITNGTGATTFSPADACTRGQIVTFLYRALAE